MLCVYDEVPASESCTIVGEPTTWIPDRAPSLRKRRRHRAPTTAGGVSSAPCPTAAPAAASRPPGRVQPARSTVTGAFARRARERIERALVGRRLLSPGVRRRDAQAGTGGVAPAVRMLTTPGMIARSPRPAPRSRPRATRPAPGAVGEPEAHGIRRGRASLQRGLPFTSTPSVHPECSSAVARRFRTMLSGRRRARRRATSGPAAGR